ncbi:MAG: hypothetical protein U0804_04415 [Gemmataceae bacterium]
MRPPDRTAVLRSLPRLGFAPPPPAAVPADPHAAFAADVAAFAAAFWALPPAERRERWQGLADNPVGPAAARLMALEPGLGVEPVAQADPRAAEVARLVKELFVLPPAARAARRLAWLTAADRTGAPWATAARAVLRADLPLARLDARLFDWFTRGERPAAVGAVAESAAWVRRRPQPVAAAPAAAGGLGCLSGPGAIVVVVVVVLRLIFAAGGPSRSSSQPPPYRPPVVAPPVMPPIDARPPGVGPNFMDFNPPNFPEVHPPGFPDVGPPVVGPPLPKAGRPPTGERFTAHEVQDFRIYDIMKQSKALRPGERPPPRYDRWVELGRPKVGSAP